jgi:hypothetical protein
VEQCQQAGLVWGRELYFDATQVQAAAALDSLTARFAVEAREATKTVEAYLTALFTDSSDEGTPPSVQSQPVEAQESTETTPLPVCLAPEQREELETANVERHDWIAQEGQPQREVHGVYQRTADVRISANDPDATPMRLKGGGDPPGLPNPLCRRWRQAAHHCRGVGGPGEVMENQPMLDLLWHVRFRWKLRPRQVTGDTKYGTIPNIRAVDDIGIRAYVPLPDWEQNSAYFGASKFTYDAKQDHSMCPNGQVLRRAPTSEVGQRILCRARASICRTCPLRPQCTPGAKSGRSVWRSFGEE